MFRGSPLSAFPRVLPCPLHISKTTTVLKFRFTSILLTNSQLPSRGVYKNCVDTPQRYLYTKRLFKNKTGIMRGENQWWHVFQQMTVLSSYVQVAWAVFCENVKKSYRIIVLVECAVFTSFCKNPNGAIATVSFSWLHFARKRCGNGRSFFTGKTNPKTYLDELAVDSIWTCFFAVRSAGFFSHQSVLVSVIVVAFQTQVFVLHFIQRSRISFCFICQDFLCGIQDFL